MSKNRVLVSVISSRLKEKSPLIQVVLGPRQVGKTTALKAALGKNGIYETADFPTPLPHAVINDWWEQAENHFSKTLAIDEVQKISGWSEVVKRNLETRRKKLKIILTGSSSLLLEKGLKETLAGRFELIKAEHWNFQEAKSIFGMSMEQYIEFGCYPGSIPLISGKERWGAYIRDAIVEPAIGRDLLQLHPVENPALLRQVFGIATSMPAQIISLQKLLGQLQDKAALHTIQNYLKLLGDAFLVSTVEKYSSSPIRTKKSSPKLIVHDNALIRAFERPISDHLSQEKKGRYFENLVGARFIESGWKTFYWKDRQLEVDYIVIGPKGEKWAIEVKTKKASRDDLKGLMAFCKLNSAFQPCLVSLKKQSFDGIKSLDVEKILSLNGLMLT